MKCPFCGKDNTKVIDSRPTDDSSIRRRRQCDECGKRFTTYEKIESMPLIVIKKDNNREPYDREKITAGIVRSCHKRPVSISQINNMVDEIETQIFNIGEKEISTKTIGEIVMSKLKAVTFTTLAFLHYFLHFSQKNPPERAKTAPVRPERH